MALLFIALLFVLIIICYTWTKKRYNYWSSKGIKGPKPFPLVGNLGTAITGKEHHDRLFQRFYNDYPNTPFVGIYLGLTPTLMVRDPEIIKLILVKEFSVFRNRNLKFVYPMNDQAFSADGIAWKVLRSIYSRSFTIGQLKTRIPLFGQCADEFLKSVDDSLEHGCDHEMQYDLIRRYNLHFAGAFLFGLDLRDMSHEFEHVLKELFRPGLLSRTVMYSHHFIPWAQKVASILHMDPRLSTIKNFFVRFVNKVIEGRHGQPAGLNDFTDQIIELKNQNYMENQNKNIKLERTDMVLVNQFVLSYAGHVDNLSAFMSLFMYELAVNQKIQDRVLKEILKVTNMYNGKITYESLNDMVYLEMVVNEVLRKYGTGFIQRQAVSDYEFPGTKLKIEKGTTVLIPTLGLHMDPNYFKDPEVFNPERFSPQNKKNIPDCTFLPFGDGPRQCVGMKSAKLQFKYGIVAFLRRFKVEPCEKTGESLQFHITGIGLNMSKGVWLKVSKRNTQHNGIGMELTYCKA